MFPSAKNRFLAAARSGFDRAIEFATLGEYRLDGRFEHSGPAPRYGVEPAFERGLEAAIGAQSRAGAARGARRRVTWTAAPVAAGSAAVRPQANVLQPATAAARRLQPISPPQRLTDRAGMRGLALSAPATRAPQGRKRPGAPQPLPQPCLVGDPGR